MTRELRCKLCGSPLATAPHFVTLMERVAQRIARSTQSFHITKHTSALDALMAGSSRPPKRRAPMPCKGKKGKGGRGK